MYYKKDHSRWHVENGEKIKIWQHHWLPRKHPPQVTSYPLESLENTTVATLIDSTTRCWNEELIDGLFAPSEAEIKKKKKILCPKQPLRMYYFGLSHMTTTSPAIGF